MASGTEKLVIPLVDMNLKFSDFKVELCRFVFLLFNPRIEWLAPLVVPGISQTTLRKEQNLLRDQRVFRGRVGPTL